MESAQQVMCNLNAYGDCTCLLCQLKWLTVKLAPIRFPSFSCKSGYQEPFNIVINNNSFLMFYVFCFLLSYFHIKNILNEIISIDNSQIKSCNLTPLLFFLGLLHLSDIGVIICVLLAPLACN